jgi:hypothetical protein
MVEGKNKVLRNPLKIHPVNCHDNIGIKRVRCPSITRDANFGLDLAEMIDKDRVLPLMKVFEPS